MSIAAALNGYQYYRNVDSFSDKVIGWDKMAPMASVAMGLSKFSVFGAIGSTPPPRTIPNVDMSFYASTILSNPSFNQTTGEVGQTEFRNYEALNMLESSAQEAISTESFYSQNTSKAASTVGLIELAAKAPNNHPPVVVTANNLIAAGSQNYSFTLNGNLYNGNFSSTVPGVWTQVINHLDYDPYSIAYLTPGFVGNGNIYNSSANATFFGVTALIIG